MIQAEAIPSAAQIDARCALKAINRPQTARNIRLMDRALRQVTAKREPVMHQSRRSATVVVRARHQRSRQCERRQQRHHRNDERRSFERRPYLVSI
ncbi:hypothetical protein A2707_02690 [Candidatus Saccharibacteria bacterium RIFCSPHIGHO2_01_FULL_45_15]|nr:MAG: hypothetical protein A2707_02690 [Candidatus Saccharibacteria bacterium RIFCSPHIGHO2_01_FULL_45_15]OGL27822.1 MAG: hypothetical protein A3C39_04955 [Candidatus Saccharibacteria bacterium RIFCSPHIGHO2_02_FULL_46_12]OGL31836.1 MAG: hypothetical protein A3E76_03285 [Candidatus Saccharibacteria bacterium RIFCSPHIGHO2_12_FULL_44_22]